VGLFAILQASVALADDLDCVGSSLAPSCPTNCALKRSFARTPALQRLHHQLKHLKDHPTFASEPQLLLDDANLKIRNPSFAPGQLVVDL